MLRILMAIVLTVIIVTVVGAMPPHPESLEKIKNGEAAKPLYLADPGYAQRMGINQPSFEPLFTPGTEKANWNTLAILVDFGDLLGTVPGQDFDSLIYAQTYYTGPSLREFYYRASYGNLDIVAVDWPSAIGWVGMPHIRHFYTAAGGTYSYGMGIYPNNSQGLCEDIISTIDPFVNFANYDNNGDSYVDGIIIIHAGREGALSLDTLDLWSHKWSITPQMRDGVYIMDYSIDSEYRNFPGDQTVGVFAHEFGHILGLPDLYDYDVPFDSYGLGYWSLMAYGGWNGNLGAPDTLAGSSPAFLDAWSRVKLNFVVPTNIPCYVDNLHIPAVEDSACVYRLWTNGDLLSNEYFLIENRHQTFTDTSLGAFGLLIFHIDDNITHNNDQWWPGQPPSNHYMVALEQADNSFHLEHASNGMDMFDPFKGGHNGTFNNTSSPSSQDYYGGNTSVAITSISNWQYVMMADVDVGATAAPGIPIPNYPDDSSYTCLQSVTMSWNAVLCASKYHCQIDDDPFFGSPLYQDSALAYNYLHYSFHGQPDGWYFWRARAGNIAGWSGWSDTRSYMMDRKRPWGSVASSPDTATSSSFLVTWTVGQDSVPSSGICTYNILADTGTGSLVYWLLGVDSLSAEFTGAVSGRTYAFQARAVDCALNQELQDPWWIPECTTYVNISGYEYLPGDANMVNGLWPPMVIGADVTFLVNYFKGTSNPCLLDGFYASADANGDCLVMGSDVIRMVAYFRGNGNIEYCSGYEPVWHNPSELPTSAPSGWPNCDP